jgi:hypothetical protein
MYQHAWNEDDQEYLHQKNRQDNHVEHAGDTQEER